jgi:hypothetical protein
MLPLIGQELDRARGRHATKPTSSSPDPDNKDRVLAAERSQQISPNCGYRVGVRPVRTPSSSRSRAGSTKGLSLRPQSTVQACSVQAPGPTRASRPHRPRLIRRRSPSRGPARHDRRHHTNEWSKPATDAPIEIDPSCDNCDPAPGLRTLCRLTSRKGSHSHRKGAISSRVSPSGTPASNKRAS